MSFRRIHSKFLALAPCSALISFPGKRSPERLKPRCTASSASCGATDLVHPEQLYEVDVSHQLNQQAAQHRSRQGHG